MPWRKFRVRQLNEVRLVAQVQGKTIDFVVANASSRHLIRLMLNLLRLASAVVQLFERTWTKPSAGLPLHFRPACPLLATVTVSKLNCPIAALAA